MSLVQTQGTARSLRRTWTVQVRARVIPLNHDVLSVCHCRCLFLIRQIEGVLEHDLGSTHQSTLHVLDHWSDNLQYYSYRVFA